MITFLRLFLISFIYFFIIFPLQAEEDSWRDKGEYLIYSPRYFGPNAFPIPVLRTALAAERFEIEIRGEYHSYSGDKTKDINTRILLPLVKGRAGVDVYFLYKEKYKLTSETRDERSAVETESVDGYHGDVIVTSYFQILKSEKWADVMASANLKTASGGRLCDARFTDAASYWFDLTAGKNLYTNVENNVSFRMQAMIGFYCWMTNDRVHRQNDALSFGIGYTGTYKGFTLSSDLSGFRGYENNGDKPLILRNDLRYEYRKNILSFHYDHGMRDRLYESYSIGYIRCF
ncbi:MAG: hypothetical protein LIP05_17220 [Tannerellaceae bacterium]|nr:hypothetical protein [Tannerellaceae bacterium]